MTFIHRAINLTKQYKKESGTGAKLADFKAHIEKNLQSTELLTLKKDVAEFSSKFPVPGI